MEIFNKIRTKGSFEGLGGYVIEMYKGKNIEEPGSIALLITEITHENYNMYKIGDIQHFAHYGWEIHMEIIE